MATVVRSSESLETHRGPGTRDVGTLTDERGRTHDAHLPCSRELTGRGWRRPLRKRPLMTVPRLKINLQVKHVILRNHGKVLGATPPTHHTSPFVCQVPPSTQTQTLHGEMENTPLPRSGSRITGRLCRTCPGRAGSHVLSYLLPAEDPAHLARGFRALQNQFITKSTRKLGAGGTRHL